MYGYAGKLLDIELSRREVKEIPLEKELIQKYLSGVGFSTKIVYDQVPPWADPLGPENVICFAVGVLAGTNIPTACRTEVSAKSPATGRFGTSNSGSFWGSELKYAGYDGIIIRGRAEEPVYLRITNDRAEILPAGFLWGKDSWETLELIREKHGDEEIQVAAIGPGGEKLCRFASIQNGPYDAWGRTGLGAVMGSKNLKAVAVRGSKPLRVYDKKRYLKAVEKCRKAIFNSPFYGPFSKFGTMLATVPYYEFGALPGRNFQTGVLKGWLETRSRHLVHKYSKRGIACQACPIACAHWVEVKEGPYAGLQMKDMEVTPLMGFAAGCDINNIPAVAKITEKCQRYGLDLVSAAGSAAFAMELYQRGILSEKEIGFKLEWGDEAALFRLIDLIARREGIGDILAEGTKRAGEKIPGASYFAMHIKGLEIPMADPRGRWSTWTFGNITNIRGGDHLRNRNPVENLRYNKDPLDYSWETFGFSEELYENMDMPRQIKEEIFHPETKDVNIPKMSKWAEDLISLYNALGMCIRPPVLQAVGPSLLAELYSSLAGIEMTGEGLMKTGERVWNLQKLFNLREGEEKLESAYPRRFYQEMLPEGPGRGRVLDPQKVQETLEEYYKARGWDQETGAPTDAKLQELEVTR